MSSKTLKGSLSAGLLFAVPIFDCCKECGQQATHELFKQPLPSPAGSQPDVLGTETLEVVGRYCRPCVQRLLKESQG